MALGISAKLLLFQGAEKGHLRGEHMPQQTKRAHTDRRCRIHSEIIGQKSHRGLITWGQAQCGEEVELITLKGSPVPRAELGGGVREWSQQKILIHQIASLRGGGEISWDYN